MGQPPVVHASGGPMETQPEHALLAMTIAPHARPQPPTASPAHQDSISLQWIRSAMIVVLMEATWAPIINVRPVRRAALPVLWWMGLYNALSVNQLTGIYTTSPALPAQPTAETVNTVESMPLLPNQLASPVRIHVEIVSAILRV